MRRMILLSALIGISSYAGECTKSAGVLVNVSGAAPVANQTIKSEKYSGRTVYSVPMVTYRLLGVTGMCKDPVVGDLVSWRGGSGEVVEVYLSGSL